MSESGPKILSFGTNVQQLTQGETVRFVAVLTEKSGLQNLVGGTLSSPDGVVKYGAFVADQQGAYSLDLTWDQINQTTEINFSTDEKRTFVGTFYNAKGEETSQSVELRLYCKNNQISNKGVCGNGCYVDDNFWDPDAKNPTNACQICKPATAMQMWSPLADGTACSATSVCSGAACKVGCYIGGAFQAPNTVRPTNPCEGCLPATRLSDWSSFGNGTSCGTELACQSATCVYPLSALTSGSVMDYRGVWGSDNNDVYAVADVGTIRHTANGGTTWAAQTSGTFEDLNGIWGSAKTDIYAVGRGNTILHSADGGATWVKQTSGVMVDFYGVWGSAKTDVYAVGLGGTILRTTNSGTTWTNQTSGTGSLLESVWGSAANDVYAVGLNGTILHTTNSGTTWTKQTSGTTESLYSVWGSGKNDVYAVGTGGIILHSTNSGTTWTKQTSGVGTSLVAVWGSSSNAVYAVTGNQILQTINGGTTWTLVSSSATSSLYGVWGNAANNVFFVGDNGLFLHHP